jgi:hypothetical protein
MMRIIARSNGDLRCLTGSGFHSQSCGLPSWVRNIASSISAVSANCEMSRYDAYMLYNASASRHSELERVDDSTISAKGVLLDVIEEVAISSVQGRAWDQTLCALLEWHEMIYPKDAHSVSRVHLAYEDTAFWRTIMGDAFIQGDGNWRRITGTDTLGRYDIHNLADWSQDTWTAFMGTTNPTQELRGKALIAASNGRTLFRTKEGRIGLCFPNSRPGDEVWVLYGGRVPFVLRPYGGGIKKENTGRMRCHSFIGEAYLHGRMDREALAQANIAPNTVYLR